MRAERVFQKGAVSMAVVVVRVMRDYACITEHSTNIVLRMSSHYVIGK